MRESEEVEAVAQPEGEPEQPERRSSGEPVKVAGAAVAGPHRVLAALVE